MRLKDPAVVAEVAAGFQRHEKVLDDNDVAALGELIWTSPLTIRFGLAENLYGHDAITAFRRARPHVSYLPAQD